MEKRRLEREQGREDAIQMRQRQAAESKQRRLQELEDQAKIKRESTNIGLVEESIRKRQADAQVEKERKLEQFKEMGKVMSSAYHQGWIPDITVIMPNTASCSSSSCCCTHSVLLLLH